SDGGVMSAEEIKKRPIQTILSGPAAGVAGALLYAKAANGFFMEVGGTSTDISVIRNGRVMVKWAQIGPHKTYINSLDIRTVAIAGGSMLRLSGGRAVCGPRSAHIAGLPYCCFAEPLCAETLRIKRFLVPGDSAEYLVLHDDASQTDYAITLTCLANYAGVVPEKDFARGSTQNVRLALEQLSRFLEKSANVILEEAFGDYCDFLEGVIAEFEDAYGLDRTELSLIGGGGGCAAVVPILAQRLKVPYQQCPNAQIISPIGVAMAMVREVCERTIGSPSQEELLRLREEAISRAVRAGAIRDKIEVVIENEPQKNLVRAIATGVTDRRLLPQDAPRLDRAELLRCIQIQSGYRD
ncbi:MAG: hydantoinase/oxoprolinase family protein, partial [Oscillospiraceae bacterium]